MVIKKNDKKISKTKNAKQFSFKIFLHFIITSLSFLFGNYTFTQNEVKKEKKIKMISNKQDNKRTKIKKKELPLT